MEKSLQTLNSQEKISVWSERIAACRSSGISVRTWCEENGISTASYYKWQKKLFHLAAADPTTMLNDFTGADKVYIACGLCSYCFYPHLLGNIIISKCFSEKNAHKIISVHKAWPAHPRLFPIRQLPVQQRSRYRPSLHHFQRGCCVNPRRFHGCMAKDDRNHFQFHTVAV